MGFLPFKLSFSSVLAFCFIAFVSLNHFSLAQNAPQDFLDVHNAARAEVGVAPIIWNETIADFARKYAEKVQAGNNCNNLTHSGGPYGENLEGGNDYITGRKAVEAWVYEKRNYDYGSNSCKQGSQCGTYTQVVWRNSLRLGCARVLCWDSWGFVICNYDPPGNVNGQRPY